MIDKTNKSQSPLNIKFQNRIIFGMRKLNFSHFNVDNQNCCEACSTLYTKYSSVSFSEYRDFEEQGICGVCYKIKNCVDFEIVRFYKYQSELSIDQIKSAGLPLLRSQKTLGQFIDKSEMIDIFDVKKRAQAVYKKLHNPKENITIFDEQSGSRNVTLLFSSQEEKEAYIGKLEAYCIAQDAAFAIVDTDDNHLLTEEKVQSIIEATHAHWRYGFSSLGEDVQCIVESLSIEQVLSNNRLVALLRVLEFVTQFYVEIEAGKSKYTNERKNICVVLNAGLELKDKITQLFEQITRLNRYCSGGLVVLSAPWDQRY